MPTTLTGVLIFVVLLLPGFVYLVGRERLGVEVRVSAFRETVSIVAASVATEVAALVLFGIVRMLAPAVTPDLVSLFRDAGLAVGWGAGLLGLATLLAWCATWPQVRALPVVRRMTYPHASMISAWWALFETWRDGRDRHVGVLLDDGSYVQGRLVSFSTLGEDSPDRDLVLMTPILYQAAGSDRQVEWGCSAACISARNIRMLTVSYLQPGQPVEVVEKVRSAAAPAVGPGATPTGVSVLDSA